MDHMNKITFPGDADYLPGDVVEVRFAPDLAPEWGTIVRHCTIDDTYEIDLGHGMNALDVPREWIICMVDA